MSGVGGPLPGVRLGVTLPTFRDDWRAALTAARDAEEAGLHGVFCFDHLWPMGHPHRPSLSLLPTLGAVAASTARIRLGPLVARVGLLPDEVLLASLLGLKEIAGERLLVGLGTGDTKSVEEHLRNGLAYYGASERQHRLHETVRQLTAMGVETWAGAGNEATNRAAQAAGLTLNFWDVDARRLAAEAARGPVTWAGPLPSRPDEAARRIAEVGRAGASFVVWGWPRSLELVVEAARLAGVALG